MIACDIKAKEAVYDWNEAVMQWVIWCVDCYWGHGGEKASAFANARVLNGNFSNFRRYTASYYFIVQ